MASAVHVCHHYLITMGYIVSQLPIPIWTYEDSSMNVEWAEVKMLTYHTDIFFCQNTHRGTLIWIHFIWVLLYAEQLESHLLLSAAVQSSPNVVGFCSFPTVSNIFGSGLSQWTLWFWFIIVSCRCNLIYQRMPFGNYCIHVFWLYSTHFFPLSSDKHAYVYIYHLCSSSSLAKWFGFFFFS